MWYQETIEEKGRFDFIILNDGPRIFNFNHRVGQLGPFQKGTHFVALTLTKCGIGPQITNPHHPMTVLSVFIQHCLKKFKL